MLSLNGRGSQLSCDIFPPIDLSNHKYEIGLIDLMTYNTIPNIEKDVNDLFHYGEDFIRIPEGSYEIENIISVLKDSIKEIHKQVALNIKGNNNTLKTRIYCSLPIRFDKAGSIGPLLGFEKKRLAPNMWHTSQRTANINKVDTIRVTCNIVRGSYNNGIEGHILHEFYPLVEPGYKIVEKPTTVIYLPLNITGLLHNISVRLEDQEGQLINFRDESVSLRLHLRRISS